MASTRVASAGCIAWLAAFAAAASPPPAAAQEIIRADCQPHVAAPSRVVFQHDKHRLWYQRYWTGKCRGLSTSFLGDACSETEPGWNQVVGELVRRGPPARAPEILASACRLGQLVGYEWAKDNNVRCIHTLGDSSLSTLRRTLTAEGDVLERIALTEARARTMCRTLRPPPQK